MASIKDIKSAIRSKYAWPGGYPLYLVTGDGQALSIDAARENWPEICRALLWNDTRDSWYVIGPDINWEDEDLYCAHSGEKIESAYGDE